MAREIEKPLLASIEAITHEVAAKYQPGLWEALPARIREVVIARVKEDAPDIVRRIMQDIQEDIDRMFDLPAMIAAGLTRDRQLLNRIFQQAGRKGPCSDRLYERVLKHVQDTIDAQAGLAKPLVVMVVGSTR